MSWALSLQNALTFFFGVRSRGLGIAVTPGCAQLRPADRAGWGRPWSERGFVVGRRAAAGRRGRAPGVVHRRGAAVTAPASATTARAAGAARAAEPAAAT